MKTTLLELDTEGAARVLEQVATRTPLLRNLNVSNEHSCKVWLKREDLQVVRSYKIRGAYHKIASLSPKELQRGIVCASAGNHAQGVAFACMELKVKGIIFMPQPTPQQKIDQVRMFGGKKVEVVLTGDTFDDAKDAAIRYSKQLNAVFVHPFDDLKVIEGQSTVAKEILEQATAPIDFLFLPVGGGGLAAGVSAYFKKHAPHTKIIGVEPKGAASLQLALKHGKPMVMGHIDKFVDGAAVKEIGENTFGFCQAFLDEVVSVDEGKVCSTILKLYNQDAIVVEPAGALSLAALDQFADQIKGKNVVCIVSGSNNDITRMEEIKERSLIYEGLKHYFLVNFPQRAGALKDFVNDVLGPHDDITHFEYIKKHNREKGPATIGIQLKQKSDLLPLMLRMEQLGFGANHLNHNSELLQLLV